MIIGNINLNDGVRAQSNTLLQGPPGFGKSRFMSIMARQDVAKRWPITFGDFHGPEFESIKRWCAHKGYYDRRINFLDPSDGRYVTPYNPFQKRSGLDIGVQASGMVEAVLSVWSDKSVSSYPVIYKLLKILFTVIIANDLNLADGFQLLGDRARLTSLVDRLGDSNIRVLWADLARLSPSEWIKQSSPTANRLYRIVQSRAIQRFMCAGGKSLEFTFNDTILVNLATSNNLDSDAARTFAALLLNDLYQSAKRRKGKAGRNPSPYFLYLDEWILLPSPDFGRILAETRKFGLLAVLANQDLSQIREVFGASFAESLLTLCQIHCVFGGLNHADATRLSKEWGIEPEVVRDLKERQCVVKLPRCPAKVTRIQEIREPFVREERVLEYEDRIARATGALPVEQVDRQLEEARENHRPTRVLQDQDFLV